MSWRTSSKCGWSIKCSAARKEIVDADHVVTVPQSDETRATSHEDVFLVEHSVVLFLDRGRGVIWRSMQRPVHWPAKTLRRPPDAVFAKDY